MKKINAIIIHSRDNVVTLTQAVVQEDIACYQDGEDVIEIKVISEIPQYHKIAIEDIDMGKPVYKYGEVIGEASADIKKGSHVHDHNIRSPEKK
jgi:altronate dehydratase small subunit